MYVHVLPTSQTSPAMKVVLCSAIVLCGACAKGCRRLKGDVGIWMKISWLLQVAGGVFSACAATMCAGRTWREKKCVLFLVLISYLFPIYLDYNSIRVTFCVPLVTCVCCKSCQAVSHSGCHSCARRSWERPAARFLY